MPAVTPGSAQGPDEVPYAELLRALRRFLRTEGERYLDDPNVASVGIGPKVTDGCRTPELSVQFVVEEKLADPGDLAARGTTPVPDAITIAGIRVPTDVLECTGAPAGRAGPAGRRSRTTPWAASRPGDGLPSAG